MKLWRLGVCAALIGTLFAFQHPFREFPGVEYRLGEIPLPPDYKVPAEWTFARLMYPPNSNRGGGGGRRFGGGYGGMGAGFGRGESLRGRADRERGGGDQACAHLARPGAAD